LTRALVTGAAGFIGSHVAERCQQLGFEVVAVDDLSGGFLDNIPPRAEFRQGSVSDADFVASLFSEAGFDYVYHLAAYAAEGLSHFIRRFNYNNNLIGSVNLINQSVLHGVRCFVFTSSIAVYGSNQTPMTEDLVPRPEDPYGISKYAVELDLAAARSLFGLDYVIFRPHNVYGERQNIADRYRNVIGIFMNQVLHGRSMTIFGDGLQTRAFSHVDDVAPVIARAPLVPAALGQVYNVGADQTYTVLQLAREVASSLGVESRIEHLPARHEVVDAFASHEKVRRDFELSPPVSLRSGLDRMSDWARLQGPMQPVTFEQIEVPVNMPASWAEMASLAGRS
jgi:UDP-glucose 4-epimerase